MIEILNRSYELLKPLDGERDRRIAVNKSRLNPEEFELTLYVNIHGKGATTTNSFHPDGQVDPLKQLCQQLEEFVNSEGFIRQLVLPDRRFRSE